MIELMKFWSILQRIDLLFLKSQMYIIHIILTLDNYPWKCRNCCNDTDDQNARSHYVWKKRPQMTGLNEILIGFYTKYSIGLNIIWHFAYLHMSTFASWPFSNPMLKSTQRMFTCWWIFIWIMYLWLLKDLI